MRPTLRLHVFLLTFLIGTCIPEARASWGCSDPLSPSIVDDSIQGLVVQWFHPQAHVDTLRLSGGRIDLAFGLGVDYHDHHVAIRIPDAAAGRLVHSVKAYFVAGDGVPAGLWASAASFAWSVRRDSSGQPGAMVEPETLWDLGLDSTLRGGGWRTGLLDILLPDSTQEAYWLVGRWPETARGVVLLGAEAGFSEVSVVLGLRDGQEAFQWAPISQPRLMIELEFLAIGDATDINASGVDLDITAVEFEILTEVVEGPGAPGVDTSSVLLPNELRFRDEPGVGQTLEYSVRAICGAEASDWVYAGRTTVWSHWDVSVQPSSIIAQLDGGSETTFTVSLTNSGQSPVVVLPDGLIFLRNNKLESSDSIQVRVDFDSLVVLSGATLDARLTVLAGYAALGRYSGTIGLRIAPADRYPIDHYLVFLDIDVGMRTGVEDPFPDRSSGVAQHGELHVRALTNPFGDEIVLLVHAEDRGANMHETNELMGSTRSFSGGEAALYNVLGQELARLVIPSDGGSLPGAISENLRITFSGTRYWPSGVYFCRVRWGNQQRTVQLVHVR